MVLPSEVTTLIQNGLSKESVSVTLNVQGNKQRSMHYDLRNAGYEREDEIPDLSIWVKGKPDEVQLVAEIVYVNNEVLGTYTNITMYWRRPPRAKP